MACCFFCATRFSDTVLLDKSYPLKLRTRPEHPQFVKRYSGGFEIELGAQSKVVELGADFQGLQLGHRHYKANRWLACVRTPWAGDLAKAALDFNDL